MSDRLVVICGRLRLFLALGLAGALAAQQPPNDASWAAVRGLTRSSKVEVHLYEPRRVRGQVVRVAEDSIAIATRDGEQVFARGDLRRVKVASAGRRVLHGAIGVSAGVFLGWMACATCRNELAEDAENRNLAVGGGVGALAFLIPGYRTIYKGPKR